MAPAVQFEKTVTVATLAGISRSWLMPSPYAYAEIEDKIYHDIMCAPSAPTSHERLCFLFDELATLNPEIKPFRDVINKPRK